MALGVQLILPAGPGGDVGDPARTVRDLAARRQVAGVEHGGAKALRGGGAVVQTGIAARSEWPVVQAGVGIEWPVIQIGVVVRREWPVIQIGVVVRRERPVVQIGVRIDRPVIQIGVVVRRDRPVFRLGLFGLSGRLFRLVLLFGVIVLFRLGLAVTE